MCEINSGKQKRSFIPVKNNVVFKMFFADERNIDLLTDFLKSVLKIPEEEYDHLEIADPHLLPDYNDDKLTIVDVKLYTKNQNIIQIELQLQIVSSFRDRIMFYNSKLITEQLGVGDEYWNIKKVISIVIAGEPLFTENPDYHHQFILYDPFKKVQFSDILEIHTLELTKLPVETDGTPLYDWVKFIKAETEEELNMAAINNPQIKRATEIVHRLSADQLLRYRIDCIEKAQRDEASRLGDALRKEEKKWQGVIQDIKTEKDTVITEKDAIIAKLEAELAARS